MLSKTICWCDNHKLGFIGIVVGAMLLSSWVQAGKAPRDLPRYDHSMWRETVAKSAGHFCKTGFGAPCIDILLTGQSEAKVGDIVDVNISIVAQQDKDATPGVWVGVEVVLNWDPAVMEPVSHTICDSLYDYFLVWIFVSNDPENLYYDCINEDLDPFDGWPDNDGDMSVLYFSPLGTEQNVFANPAILGTMRFRVLATGNHTVGITPSTDCFFPDNPQAIPIETQILSAGNFIVTGDLSSTYNVEVRSAFDTIDPPGVGIEDFLALLAAWSAGE